MKYCNLCKEEIYKGKFCDKCGIIFHAATSIALERAAKEYGKMTFEKHFAQQGLINTLLHILKTQGLKEFLKQSKITETEFKKKIKQLGGKNGR